MIRTESPTRSVRWGISTHPSGPMRSRMSAMIASSTGHGRPPPPNHPQDAAAVAHGSQRSRGAKAPKQITREERPQHHPRCACRMMYPTARKWQQRFDRQRAQMRFRRGLRTKAGLDREPLDFVTRRHQEYSLVVAVAEEWRDNAERRGKIPCHPKIASLRGNLVRRVVRQS